MSTVEPESAASEPRERANWKWLSVGLAASPLLFAAARILIYSGGDPVVLRTLVRTLNVQSILLGSLLPVTTAIFALAVYAWAYYNDVKLRVRKLLEGRPVLRGSLIVAGLILLIVSPVLNVVLFASLAIGLGFGTFLGRRRLAKNKPPGFLIRHARQVMPDKPLGPSSWLAVPVMALVFLFVVPTGMWLPLERLTSTTGTNQSAYVLDDSQGWMTTISQEHVIKSFHSNSVKARVICDQGDYTSIITWLLGTKSVPWTNCSAAKIGLRGIGRWV